MALEFPSKDPDEVLDYSINWSAPLEGDTIATSTWIMPVGITKGSDSFSPTSTTIWLSGGSESERYSMVNRITTAAGRTMDQTVRIKIKVR